jgi:mono/diheme cytochrome c family protein
MREQLAHWIAALVAVFVLLLALAFAWIQNLSAPVPAPAAAPALVDALAECIARGRTVYETQGCVLCHSIAGIGNPRVPLDPVGARRPGNEIRKWIIGAEEVAKGLSENVRARKQRYRELAPEDLATLVAYLQILHLWALVEKMPPDGESVPAPKQPEIAATPRVEKAPRKSAVASRPSLKDEEEGLKQAEVSPMAKTVIVRRGDTLSLIAERAYGDPTQWPLIYKANKDKIRDPNLISVGLELVLPRAQELMP